MSFWVFWLSFIEKNIPFSFKIHIAESVGNFLWGWENNTNWMNYYSSILYHLPNTAHTFFKDFRQPRSFKCISEKLNIESNKISFQKSSLTWQTTHNPLVFKSISKSFFSISHSLRTRQAFGQAASLKLDWVLYLIYIISDWESIYFVDKWFFVVVNL